MSCELVGLEPSNLRIRNKALLANWLCRFTLEPESLWHRIIVSKPGIHPFEWMEKRVKVTHQNPGILLSFQHFLISLITLWGWYGYLILGGSVGGGEFPLFFVSASLSLVHF
ncbi:Electron transfer flavoprotein-ubiquinone oxidoreductase [Cucumis melo var. makuwa]|uniref:Electron transfer flavoprotein-ubiquinone oxidoreductase n=1 Tax=Cucumis melo var. makuwa TaxID=1194695 RepID=A0A5D3C8M3_CUCMM|nr:Electron transfer flavoprotein-ubiquinone oxidoreductase [Cucumis melo var. makuwa]